MNVALVAALALGVGTLEPAPRTVANAAACSRRFMRERSAVAFS